MATEVRATYRVQLRPDFDFDAAAAIADYLARLGISHLYSSPQLQAARGSTHGYDVVDHSRISADLGGDEGHRRLQAALVRNGLGLVLDIVPNHMAITGPESRWWWDVLEHGQSSRYAAHFDVEWDPPESYLRNKILLPVLGEQYGVALESAAIRLVRDGDWFTVRYRDQSFPVAPQSLDGVLRAAAERSGSDDLAFLADVIGRLPLAPAADRATAAKRWRDTEVAKRQFGRLRTERAGLTEAVDRVIVEVNADPDTLDAILERQHYRLAYWRAARRDLGYRRFFGINSLVGLRVEDDLVFHDTHRLILRLVEAGAVDGLRVDHPDGLRDPQAYLDRLREHAPEAWLIVEKVLERDEQLAGSWPVDGTTGYDFMNLVGGLFVDPAGEAPLTRLYEEIVGRPVDYGEELRDAKDLVLSEELGSDLNRLTQLFLDVAEGQRRYRDFTRDELHTGLRAVIACWPVYRTYVRAERREISPDDARVIRDAIASARVRRPDVDAGVFDLLSAVLLLEIGGPLETELVMRLQQLTGPAMAKGAEDTVFYRFNRLISLNEVGGDPGRFGVSPAEFHAFAAQLAARWPRSMTTTSTHDMKRGEDVRTRIAALSEIPRAWTDAVTRWRSRNAVYRSPIGPDANDEYLLYQTLVGTWPIGFERLDPYLAKALREAKVRTSWAKPDGAYEGAVLDFAHGILSDPSFCADLEAFVAPVVRAARISSLAQLLLKLTAPGVPDVYQGTELWDLTLVDPDNRRAVDYDARRRLLDELESTSPADVLGRMDEGVPKLWLLSRALRVRAERPNAFGPGAGYRPLQARGARAANVVAFVRGESAAVTVVPRLVMGLGDPPDWGSTTLELPPGHWRDALSGVDLGGGAVTVESVLHEFPVALLVAQTG